MNNFVLLVRINNNLILDQRIFAGPELAIMVLISVNPELTIFAKVHFEALGFLRYASFNSTSIAWLIVTFLFKRLIISACFS
jgi:hypothetical protein